MIKIPLNNPLRKFSPIVVLDLDSRSLTTLGKDFRIVVEKYSTGEYSWDEPRYKLLDQTTGRYIAIGFKKRQEAYDAIHRFYKALKNGERFFDFGED